jgi:hypothetical protein
VERLDIVDVDIEVEHVRRNDLAVRPRPDVAEAGEMDVGIPARDVGVVLRIELPLVAVETELLGVVVERTADVVDEQHGSVALDVHARARARISWMISLFASA